MKEYLQFLISGILAICIGIVFNVIYEFNTVYTFLAIIALGCYVSGIGLTVSSTLLIIVNFFKQKFIKRRQ